jgi:hypothetical protein
MYIYAPKGGAKTNLWLMGRATGDARGRYKTANKAAYKAMKGSARGSSAVTGNLNYA